MIVLKRFTLKQPKIIGGIEFGSDHVVLAAPITHLEKVNDIQSLVNLAKENKIDMFEIRYDYLINDGVPLDDLLSSLNKIRYPYIFTFRSYKEGGMYNVSDMDRLKIIENAIDYKPTIIDLELYLFYDEATKDYVRNIMKKCKDNGIHIIISYHNFNETPDYSTLYNIGEKEKQNGADILKIATKAMTLRDNITVLLVTYDLRMRLEMPMITMAMGDLGKVSRILTPLFGSDLIFVNLIGESAPGQIAPSLVLRGLEFFGEL